MVIDNHHTDWLLKRHSISNPTIAPTCYDAPRARPMQPPTPFKARAQVVYTVMPENPSRFPRFRGWMAGLLNLVSRVVIMLQPTHTGVYPVTTSRVLLSLSIALMLALSCAAQTSTSQISGVVRDSSGAVIPGATVTLTNEATGVVQKQSTTEAGVYAFPSIPVGA